MMALALLVGVLLLEVGVRFYHWSQGRPLLASTSFLDRDPRLGWRPAGGLRVERVLADASGRSYRARVTTDRHGFRRAPEPAPGTPRILFLGDSFTHAVEVGDEHAYHAVFARRMPEYAVFAIGAGGYGPLQEALLLEEVYPRVEPDCRDLAALHQ